MLCFTTFPKRAHNLKLGRSHVPERDTPGGDLKCTAITTNSRDIDVLMCEMPRDNARQYIAAHVSQDWHHMGVGKSGRTHIEYAARTPGGQP